MASDILIIDDEEDIRELVAGILKDEGYETRVAATAQEALQAINARIPKLIFLDIWLQDSEIDGLVLLDIIKASYADLPVVMISGHGTIDTAVSAIKRGAYDFIEKPFKIERLLLVARRALETSQLRREVEEWKNTLVNPPSLIGNSPAVKRLRHMVEAVAPTNSRVFIHGPLGCGKEMTARFIHTLSPRKNGAFVVLNIGNIPPCELEAELLGQDFLGGRRKIGALEEAHGGTLYIDEVADMPLGMQKKLLRILVEDSFSRVDGIEKTKVNVRIIASSSQNLEELIGKNFFLADLYHRLAVVPIHVPALAERRGDIPFFVNYFIEQFSKKNGAKKKEITEDALMVFMSHDWPGNLRQLRNAVERLLILVETEEENAAITADLLPQDFLDALPHIPSQASQFVMSLPLKEAREAFEKEYLLAQIARFGGNISKTAEFVGMERSALHRKLKGLGI